MRETLLLRLRGVGSLSALALLALAACSSAPGAEEGGAVLFTPTAASTSPSDAGDDACSSNANVDAGFGSGWSDLYRDYFGPTGQASCAGTAGACHGDPTATGAVNSDYVCAGTVAGCYAGITSGSAGLVTIGDTTDDPTTSGLYGVLRKACIGGEMPKQPANFFFSAADMKRITDWIGAGAPNN
jgi:hypothetical protein